MTGELIDTIIRESSEWGVCGPCKAACDLWTVPVTLEYMEALTALLVRFQANTVVPLVPDFVIGMIQDVARGPRTPWKASGPPPATQISRRWIE